MKPVPPLYVILISGAYYLFIGWAIYKHISSRRLTTRVLKKFEQELDEARRCRLRITSPHIIDGD